MRDWKKKSKMILDRYKDNLPAAVYEKAQSDLDEMLLHEEVSPELASHCYVRIFPMIALYKAMKERDPAHAYQQASELFWKKQVVPEAKRLQQLLKIPGLYKLIPRLTVFTVKKKYKASPKGFQYDLLETSPSCARLVFHQCPYYNYCAKYGVPELCDAFCTSDDISAGAMSPYIQFTRTQTIGRGGNCCDFSYEIAPRLRNEHKKNFKNQQE